MIRKTKSIRRPRTTRGPQRTGTIGVALALVGALALGATPAQAHDDRHGHGGGGGGLPTPGSPQTLATGLLGPLSLGVGDDGSSYASQNFGGSVTEVNRRGQQNVYTAAVPGSEISAVSTDGRRVLFTEGTPDGSSVLLQERDKRGKIRTVADIGAHEQATNPDGGVIYGFRDLAPDCAAQVPPEAGGASHPGEVFSHPYASTTVDGTTYVADAGANAIWSVDRRGTVRTVAVLPAQPLAVTAEVAAATGMPECTIGHTYYNEPVPTDVERGPDGRLFVSLLPGGPEDPSLGARGAVYTVSQRGKVSLYAGGLLTATNLAVSPRGDVYVAELFASRISVIRKGTTTPVPFADVVMPGALEWTSSALYVTSDVLAGLPTGPEEPGEPDGTSMLSPTDSARHRPTPTPTPEPVPGGTLVKIPLKGGR
ncbi:ScyD/ScyE family protein [Oerskovia enterophila]|uniref:ScyD/ScyE family protein n=1 Tax=Oerskovia enterophila TaxID=43678 RepID=A0ABX2Y2V8_9CELL|nr:ScyD/ScyE family protein [Oerskovia enterophila]OCI30897.1 hypothetical protein OERS_23510 [Oerskovia enterophila]